MKASVRTGIILVGGYALAAVGSAVAASFKVPLAWVTGALLVAATLSISNVKVIAPVGFRRAGQIIIGVTGGLSVTPTIAWELLGWLPAMILTALSAIFVSATLSPAFALAARVDSKTAFFSMLPGGLSEMGNLGASLGARMEPIALIHTLRVAIVVFAVPAVLVHGATLVAGVTRADLSAAKAAILIVAGLAGALLVRACRLNNPFMIGALLASAMLSASGLLSGRMPHEVFAVGQILLGYNIGSRFKRSTLASMPRVALMGVMFIVLLLILMALYALALELILGLDYGTSLLVSSPGGTSEMTTTAEALNLSVATVTAFHLTRTVMVNGFAAYFFKLFAWSGYLQAIERFVACIARTSRRSD